MSEALLEMTGCFNSNHYPEGVSRLSLDEIKMESHRNRSLSLIEQNEIAVVDLPQSTV